MTVLPGRPSERDAWVALASAPGVGDATFARLLETYGSAANVLELASRMPPERIHRRLRSDVGFPLPRALAAAIRASAEDPHATSRWVRRLDGWTLTPLDATYPAALHELEHPPSVLFGLGQPEALVQARMTAVVGTRRPTPVARDLAARVCTRLAAHDAVVVSGLAVGVDAIAHRATLEAAGTTVAVIGSGLDAPGPVSNRSLARVITERGAIIGELAPGVRATRGTFPRRNRIISALATSTIVIEAPARSGALITARHALEQGRQLLVAPGRPLDRSVAGCLGLLRESPARPLVGLDEMIADLHFDVDPDRTGKASDPVLTAAVALESLGPAERAIAACLIDGPRTVDSIVATSGLGPGEVAGALTILQLRGWARVHGAMQMAAGPLLDPGASR